VIGSTSIDRRPRSVFGEVVSTTPSPRTRGLHYCQRAAINVHVNPSKTEDFSASHTCHGSDPPESSEWVVSGCAYECTEFIRIPSPGFGVGLRFRVCAIGGIPSE
jgi:hypothetical protein